MKINKIQYLMINMNSLPNDNLFERIKKIINHHNNKNVFIVSKAGDEIAYKT